MPNIGDDAIILGNRCYSWFSLNQVIFRDTVCYNIGVIYQVSPRSGLETSF